MCPRDEARVRSIRRIQCHVHGSIVCRNNEALGYSLLRNGIFLSVKIKPWWLKISKIQSSVFFYDCVQVWLAFFERHILTSSDVCATDSILVLK